MLMTSYRFSSTPLICAFLFLLSILITPVAASDHDDDKRFYIVYLEGYDSPMDEASAIQTHVNVLMNLKGSEAVARESMVYSYHKCFNAFAAKLTKDEAEALSDMDMVVLVSENRYHKLHTTKSWDFIGFPITAKRRLHIEKDIIVGVLDTGITPDAESFRDDGFGPVPAKWKGSCGPYANFSGCNRKLIGAKYFKLDRTPNPSDVLSPLDIDGHGTHTSSTSAGNLVPNSSLYGYAKGTARGTVPSSRIAAYKVCWQNSDCADMDILAGFEAAINDGVDVISISIGGISSDYTEDGIAIGSFRAMKKGILTIASAGNSGPSLASVSNHAPWILIVAASGIDRTFKSRVDLGNGEHFYGIGISAFKTESRPVVYGEDVAKDKGNKTNARYCLEDSLNPSKVKGKLVLCVLNTWGVDSVIKRTGGIGTIIASNTSLDSSDIFMAPSTMIDFDDGHKINDYIHSTRSPSAVLHKTEELKIKAPFIASFSSRGPNPGSRRILKPDIAAPGVDILAAYSPLATLTGLQGDTQYSKFSIMSGTSMSCPHVSGVAAYVKSFHPTWSASAIRSAIMTSATPMSKRVTKEAEFAYGTGQVNPRRARSPGLIYDMEDEMPYIQFLCHEGYNGKKLSVIVGSDRPINCSSLIPAFGYDSLNYPTMQFHLKKGKKSGVGVFRRRVTNVGPEKIVYHAIVRAPKGVEIMVTPMTLNFTHKLQRRAFKVVVKVKDVWKDEEGMVSGLLIWIGGKHVIRSPIVVHNYN